jgi:hypothetical protein
MNSKSKKMSVVSGSSSSSGFEIEPIDTGDENGDERKLNLLKKLIAEQDPGADVNEIAHLDQESAKKHYFLMDTSTSDWTTIEFNSDKTYPFDDKALKAEDLVNMYIEKGKQVIKEMNKTKASKDPWEKFQRSGYKRMNPDIWFEYCKKQKIDVKVPVVFIDKEDKTAIKVLDIGTTTGAVRGWQVLTDQGDLSKHDKFFGMPQLSHKCMLPN